MKGSLWTWIFQRFTAVLLIVLLGVHFGIMHFVSYDVTITFANSSARLKDFLYLIVDSGLLALGLFHGLNGIRNILMDYWPRAGKASGWVLGLVGIVAVAYGSTALSAFLAK